MTLTKRREQILDGKECFMLRVELPTCFDVAKYLAKAGVVNPKSGKQFTPFAVWHSSMKWVIFHPDEARPYYQAEHAPYAFDDEEWEKWLVLTAMRIFRNSRGSFLRWMRVMKLDKEKYKPLYAKRYGITGWNVD
jgi:hypothetical protein